MKRFARSSNRWLGREPSVVETTSCKLTLGRAVARAIMVAEVLLAGCSTIAAPAFSSTGSANYVQPLRPSSSAPARHKSSGIVTASRYSRDLAGNCTSNGERYNPNSLTAASRRLPIGSTVKVTNVDNGNSVNVRINDRGPHVPGRSLDLSARAARDIGLADQGVAKVKITSQPLSARSSAPPAHCD
jgi:rare lipoprotein A